MSEAYRAHGVGFHHPTSWTVTEEADGAQLTVSVQSPGASFWMLTLRFDRPEPRDVIRAVLQTFEEEYDEIDTYGATAALCQRPNEARDLDFVCLDAVNSAFVRSFRTPKFTALVLYQGDQRELEQTRPILESISRSLVCEPPEA